MRGRSKGVGWVVVTIPFPPRIFAFSDYLWIATNKVKVATNTPTEHIKPEERHHERRLC